MHLILLNRKTLKLNLIVSGNTQGLIKCPFFSVKLHFSPFTGLFISKCRFSPHIKLKINETKNTSTNGLMKAVKDRLMRYF